MVKNKIFAFAIGVLCSLSLSSKAQDNNFSYYMVEKELEVISATKEYVSYTSVPRYMRVITREELDRWGVRNLFDLLRKFPEFYVRKTEFYLNAVGALGLKQSYFSEKVQVLIDGIPMMDPSTGSSFSTNNNFSLDNVKRVEIVYGPMTSLYGFNASLAIINLITYDSDDLNFKTGTYVNTDGSNDSYFVKTFNSNHWKGLLSLDYNEEKGPYKEYTDPIFGLSSSISAYHKHFTYYVKLKHDSGLYFNFYGVNRDSTFPISLTGLITDGDNTYTDRVAYINKIGLRRSFGEINVDTSLFYNWFYLKRGYNICPADYPYCASIDSSGLIATEKRYVRNYGVNTEVSFRAANGKVTTGFELSQVDMYKTEMAANFIPATTLTALLLGNKTAVQTFPYRELSDEDKILDEAERTIVSPYFQYFFSGERYSVLTNVRWDRSSDVGSTLSYSLSGMFKASERTFLKLNVGKSVRIPSFEEMYIKNNPVLLGNRDLKYEKIYSFMPSVEYTGDTFKFSALFYVSLIRDMIYKREISKITRKWDNASEDVRVKGFVLSLNKNFFEGEVYGELGRRMSFKGIEGTSCAEFPSWKGVVGYSLIRQKFDFDVNTEAYSRVGDVPGYYLVNMVFTFKPMRYASLGLRIDNLLDRKVLYPVSSGAIEGEGRILWLGLDILF
ncbi:iron complex outermembrane recepter protein [Desulfurobacterium pacificum]|uniref:Iron complex outermembrane recepter protein n=1 Tax=Desulfurobacterium pacificum TaxID=240166 RepID=A0ABY1N6I2_9BACT|nr:TonB-dependent receptor [Desulfurobacterium pacificum]SMP01754.1 iron complex outermembrane recepter protein [Desulfurobacterium pacificum]